MGRILKTLAFATGAGLAIGICTMVGSRRATRPDPFIDVEPLLDRLETIERRLESAGVERISAIERTLAEQCARAQETDANLQRLILSIERLCERVPVPAPTPAPGILLPFESHLRDASNEMESEDAPKKSRFPIARIFGMIALVVLTQVLR